MTPITVLANNSRKETVSAMVSDWNTAVSLVLRYIKETLGHYINLLSPQIPSSPTKKEGRHHASFQHASFAPLLQFWLISEALMWNENSYFINNMCEHVRERVRVCLCGCISVFLPSLSHTCPLFFFFFSPANVLCSVSRHQPPPRHFLLNMTPVACLCRSFCWGLRCLVEE